MELKYKTAKTIKWNAIDRVATQVLYGVSGIVLANLISKEDFGLVGVLAVFQAFAILFVDSGFGSALLQKKNPDNDDYSTVFWFNLAVSCVVYAALFLSGPAIARFFGDSRLDAMSKVMFLTFVLNGLGIVQTNRLMKRMDVRNIAVADLIALSVSGLLGVILAFMGFGAWAIVWQSVTLAAVKTIWLWLTGHWFPALVFSNASMRDIRSIGLSVFTSQFFNTLFLNVYQFVIGKWYSLAQLGSYSQADKWSKMGSASLSQILTSSFVPVLARVQDDIDTFHRYMKRIDRFTAFITFPSLTLLAACGPALFHFLFASKWDVAIPLFQILCLRGIGVVFISLYGNFLMALGRGRQLVYLEVVKDVATAVALVATVFSMRLDTLVWGQLFATLVTWIAAAAVTSRYTLYSFRCLAAHLIPFAAVALAASLVAFMLPDISGPVSHPFSLPVLLDLSLRLLAGGAVAVFLFRVMRVPELPEAFRYVFGRFLHSRSR